MTWVYKIFKRIKYKILNFFKTPKLSKGEAFVKAWLDINNIKYISQYRVKVPTNIRKSGNCYIDFYIKYKHKKFAIEYNGRQHYEFVPRFHKNHLDLKAQLMRDAYIKDWCREKGITFIEIPYTWNSDNIVDQLKEIKSV